MAALMQSLWHPSELRALHKIKFGGAFKVRKFEGSLEHLANTLSDRDFCYAVLNEVSRSFALVIQALPKGLMDAVCIFYLVLRGLDSIEDDMDIDDQAKLAMLRTFADDIYEDGWQLKDVGDGPAYRVLLAHFDKVIRVFKGLDTMFQRVITDTTRRMATGMCKYVERPTALEGVKTCAEYDMYCHYVAGLVGHGLSALFAFSGVERQELVQERELQLADSMGKFLQKTNIIRDYLEDIVEGRTWWPEEIWAKHGSTLREFSNQPYNKRSLACLNDMVTDALYHVPDVMEYLSLLRNEQVFSFCAVPQVMAIATLSKLYNNPSVFSKVVKIRKGLACRIMLDCGSMAAVQTWFHKFLSTFDVPSKDPSAERTDRLLVQALNCSRPLVTLESLAKRRKKSSGVVGLLLCILVVLFLLWSQFGVPEFFSGTVLGSSVQELEDWDNVMRSESTASLNTVVAA
eukprot:CAMPEP_0205824286 /NCGR_PEP_ID=MMETSP0206-20130828/20294_1 /ASSEMBLY_ACC=CAM_ASM_000279 /TAXON_ID=36767 /ORGANISM="Euplotes focardii, Strain TN1" /LENGTH=458 /DNA_ID=CAMNT_0053122261 /DNA_START=30 /DNA_END=1404 /DNA_ORIENTATION=+